MKKKQKKSRNVRKKRPLPKKIVNRSKGLNNTKSTASSTYVATKTLKMADIRETDMYSSESGDFIFHADNPVLEFRSGTNVTNEPMINLMQPAWEIASNFVEAELRGAEQNYDSILKINPNLRFPLYLLTKLVLTETEGGDWCMDINYVDLVGEEKSNHFAIPVATETNSRENLEGFMISLLAGLIVESGNVFPEFGIQARTFLIDDLYLMVPAWILSDIKTNDKLKEKRELFDLEVADCAFRQLKAKCGGEFTDKAFHEISEVDANILTFVAMMSNLHGQRCWPFKDNVQLTRSQQQINTPISQQF